MMDARHGHDLQVCGLFNQRYMCNVCNKGVDICKDQLEKGNGMHGHVVNMHVNACFGV